MKFISGINVCFWETAHLSLPQPNIKPHFSLWTKWRLKGGVGGQFPRNIHWSDQGIKVPGRGNVRESFVKFRLSFLIGVSGSCTIPVTWGITSWLLSSFFFSFSSSIILLLRGMIGEMSKSSAQKKHKKGKSKCCHQLQSLFSAWTRPRNLRFISSSTAGWVKNWRKWINMIFSNKLEVKKDPRIVWGLYEKFYTLSDALLTHLF